MSKTRAKCILFALFERQERPMVDFQIGNEQNTRKMHPFRAIREAGAPNGRFWNRRETEDIVVLIVWRGTHAWFLVAPIIRNPPSPRGDFVRWEIPKIKGASFLGRRQTIQFLVAFLGKFKLPPPSMLISSFHFAHSGGSPGLGSSF